MVLGKACVRSGESGWFGSLWSVSCLGLLRLREELESFNNSPLELQRETLNAEVHFLKSVSVPLLFPSRHHHAGLLLNSRTVMSFEWDQGVEPLDFLSKCSAAGEKKRPQSFFTLRATVLQGVIQPLPFSSRSWTPAREVSSIKVGQTTAMVMMMMQSFHWSWLSPRFQCVVGE